MAELQFDENGFPIWSSAAGPSDPEPVSAAIAAVNSIGQPGGIPYPGSMPEMSPGAVPVGAPPLEMKQNALINPGNDSYEYPPGPQPLAAPQPAIGTGTPAGLAPFDPQQVMSAPADGYGQPAAPVAPAPAVAPTARPAVRGAKPGRMDPVAQANAAVDNEATNAAQALYDHGVATNEAARQLSERRAMAGEVHAQRMADSDAQFQAARNKAQKDAEIETAQWMANLEAKAKEEPNPKRWFANQSTPGKALWLLSLAFGTKAAATAPGVQNIGLAMIQEEIQKDVGEQKARLAREMEVMRTRGAQMDKRQAERMAFLRDDHNIRAGQLLALEKAALERANAPGSADDKAAYAAAHSWLANQRMALAATRAQQAFQAKESQLSRGHSAWMQRNAQQFQAEQANIDRAERAAKDALDRSFKFAESANAAAAKKAEKGANTFTVDPQQGVALVKNGKAGALSLDVSKEFGQKRAEQVSNLSNAANEVVAELDIIEKAIADGSFMERLLGSDANLQAAVTRLGYSKAKENDPRGIVTNADFTAGLVSAMGAKYDSTSGRFLYEAKNALSGKDPSAELIKSIQREKQVVESRTNAKLNTYVPLEERDGGNIVWRAKNRNPAEAQTETLDQAAARLSGGDQSGDWGLHGIVEPESVKDLEEAQKKAAAGALDALPKYHRREDGTSTGDVVQEAKQRMGWDNPGAKTPKTSLSPELTLQFSEDYQKQPGVGQDSRARLEILQATETAVNIAREREERVKALAQTEQMRTGKVDRERVTEIMEREGLGPMKVKAEYVDEIMKAVDAVSDPMVKWKRGGKK